MRQLPGVLFGLALVLLTVPVGAEEVQVLARHTSGTPDHLVSFSIDLDAAPAAPPSEPVRILDVATTVVGPELGPGGWFLYDNAARALLRLRFPPATAETVSTIGGTFPVVDLAFDARGELWLLGGGQLHQVDWRSGQVLAATSLSGDCDDVVAVTFHQGALLGANGDICTVDTASGVTMRGWRFWDETGGWFVNDLASDGDRLVAVDVVYAIPGPPFPYPTLHTVDLSAGELTQISVSPFASYTPGFDFLRLQAPGIPASRPLGRAALALALAIAGIAVLRLRR